MSQRDKKTMLVIVLGLGCLAVRGNARGLPMFAPFHQDGGGEEKRRDR